MPGSPSRNSEKIKEIRTEKKRERRPRKRKEKKGKKGLALAGFLKPCTVGLFCRRAGSQKVFWESHVFLQLPEILKLLSCNYLRVGVLLDEVSANKVSTEP